MKRIFIFSILWLALCLTQIKAAVNTEDPNNTIYIPEITTIQDGQIALSVCMKNSVKIGGFQFEIRLPQGFTFDYTTKNDKDRASALLTQERTDSECHIFSTVFLDNTHTYLRVLCYSNTGDMFSGNDGEVATIVVNVDPTTALGTYEVKLSDIVISNDTDTYETAKAASTIEVVDNRYDVNRDGVVNITDVTEVVDFILKRQNRNSAK